MLYNDPANTSTILTLMLRLVLPFPTMYNDDPIAPAPSSTLLDPPDPPHPPPPPDPHGAIPTAPPTLASASSPSHKPTNAMPLVHTRAAAACPHLPRDSHPSVHVLPPLMCEWPNLAPREARGLPTLDDRGLRECRDVRPVPPHASLASARCPPDVCAAARALLSCRIRSLLLVCCRCFCAADAISVDNHNHPESFGDAEQYQWFEVLAGGEIMLSDPRGTMDGAVVVHPGVLMSCLPVLEAGAVHALSSSTRPQPLVIGNDIQQTKGTQFKLFGIPLDSPEKSDPLVSPPSVAYDRKLLTSPSEKGNQLDIVEVDNCSDPSKTVKPLDGLQSENNRPSPEVTQNIQNKVQHGLLKAAHHPWLQSGRVLQGGLPVMNVRQHHLRQISTQAQAPANRAPPEP